MPVVTGNGARDAEHKLSGGALGLSGVLMQAITHIGPAIGLATSIAFITSLAGVTAPLAFGIAFVLVLSIGGSLTQLAKMFPSAGGYYTYVSRTIHPRAGLEVSWIYFLYDPLGGCINMAFFGWIFQEVLLAKYGINVSWWIPFLFVAAIVTFFLYSGIKISARALIVLGALEILIVLALAISGFISPGPGGVPLDALNPAKSLSISGLYLAVIFSILTFSGFESVAPLAEESRDPTRTLPRAIMASIIIMGVFFILTAWGVVAGFGARRTVALATSVQNPLLVVGERVWGVGWIVILIAIFNSAVAVAIACSNASTRVFYGMARSGSLPKLLAKIDPRHHTPINAVILQTCITLAFGLGIGFWIGPSWEFSFTGVTITIGLIFIYGAGNIGVTRYYWREHRSSFRWFVQGVCPIGSTLGLIWVGYKSIIPLPSGPTEWAPYTAAFWVVAGIALIWWLHRTGREDWLANAGQAAYEVPSAEHY
jgi:amino acid transporter